MSERRLILMRHAKSSWAIEGQPDHERPLNKRGRLDAPRIATELSALGWVPDFVVSSDAQRTQQTWAGMAEVLGQDTPLRLTEDLYLAGLGQLQEDAQHWPEAAETVLALGHNPGWEQALCNLSDTWHGMTTANAALLEGEGATWVEALEKIWRLEALLRPKDLS